MSKKTKIIVLSSIAVVIVALVIVLIIVLGGGNADKTVSSSSSFFDNAEVVSIDESDYSNKVAVMTPTDATSVVGKWVLTGIQTAEGGNADVVEVLGRQMMTTDLLQFMDDGSFSNYVGGVENKGIDEITGMYTVNGSEITLTYGDGKTSSATFDSVKQILTVKENSYTYTFLRLF